MNQTQPQPNHLQVESESIAYRLGAEAEAVIGPGDRPLIELWHKGFSIVVDVETKKGRVVFPQIEWTEGVAAAEEAVKNRVPIKWPNLPAANDNRDFCANPFMPEAAGGLLESIAQWSLNTSRRPVPEFAMMAAIGFLSALYGRRYVGPTGAGLNLYMVGIADPGFGKEEPLKLIQNLGRDSKQMKLIGPGDVTAGSAIEKVLRRQPVQILPMDEFGVILESVNGKGASSWAKTIRKTLLDLYAKSTSIWSGKEYADPSRSAAADPIYCPTLSLLGMSTPTTFYNGLTEASLSDGFL